MKIENKAIDLDKHKETEIIGYDMKDFLNAYLNAEERPIKVIKKIVK